MQKGAVRRLWFPFTILIFFASTALLNKDFLFQFSAEAISQSQKVLAYAIQIGIWLSAAHFINRFVNVVIWDGFVRNAIGTAIPRLLKDVLGIFLYIVAITGIVGFVFHQSVTAFWATSGVVGLVLGLALKNMILDVFTGLAINIDRPYKIGDWIEVHNVGADGYLRGKVLETNWRTTRLHTIDDSLVVLPNSVLGEKAVINFWGSGPTSRFETIYCLDFSIPPERALRVLLAAVKAVAGEKGILTEPAPRVLIGGTNAMGTEYIVLFWMKEWDIYDITLGGAKSLINQSVLAHLNHAGITPAYPKQDLYYAEMPARHLDSKSLEDRTKLLGNTELFQPLEHDELRQLAASMKQTHFKNGDKLIRQGDTGNSMFILSEGLLHVFINSNQNGGHELKVGQIIPGQFFGEMSLLTGEMRSATIVAATDVIAHEITKNNIENLLSDREELFEMLSTVIAERKVRNSQQLAAASVEERIEQTQSMANQIMTKMKAFFRGVFKETF
jgi:small-conductance mechanosensitive channel/CRP-like cAMP-binding protein